MHYQIPLVVIVVLALMSTGVAAIWISGWSLTGAFIGNSGSTGTEQTAVWDINVTETGNLTSNFTYSNQNGETSVQVNLLDNISSSVGNCQYEANKDIKFFIDDRLITEASPISYDLEAGDNLIVVTVEASEYRCPTLGNFGVWFTA